MGSSNASSADRRSACIEFWRNSRRWVPYVFLAPFFVSFLIFTGWPMLRAVTMAFQEMHGLLNRQWEFVGLSNFREALTSDPHLRISFRNFVYYAGGSLLTQVPAALGLAVLLTSKRLRGRGFFRTLFFIPSVLPGVTMGVIGLWLFSKDRGLVNELLLFFGAGERINFLLYPKYIMPMLLGVAFWRFTGRHAIYLIAGVSGIDTSIIEAAIIDGASGWQLVRYITLPMLRPVFAYVSITVVSGSLLVYQVPTMMLGDGNASMAGGPAGKGWFFVPYIIREAFDQFRFGYATAIGWLVFFLSVAVSFLQLRFFGFGEAD